MTTFTADEIRSRVETDWNRIVKVLAEKVALQSISAKGITAEHMKRSAEFVADELRLVGVDTKVVQASNADGTPGAWEVIGSHIVSPDDRSKRLLPTGSSKLIVKSATVKTVDFACTGLVLDGVGLDDVISTFKTEMMAVYSAAKETNILRYNSARTVLSTITGVSDFIDFTMDGKRENIHLSSSEYADTGNVTFTLEGAET